LIGLALICGLAILVAGMIQLFRLQGAKDSTEARAIGVSTDVDGVTAVVTNATKSDDGLLLEVEVTSGDAGIDDPAVGWGVLDRGRVVTMASATCEPEGKLAPRDRAKCSLAFASGRTELADLVAAYRYGNATANWVLVHP
jgi:hypothetical protein